MTTTSYLDLADVLLIAESITGVDAVHLQRASEVHLLETALLVPSASRRGEPRHPTLAGKAAALLVALVDAAALPRANERVAWTAMREFLGRNGERWRPDPRDADEIAGLIAGVRAGRRAVEELTAWIEEAMSASRAAA